MKLSEVLGDKKFDLFDENFSCSGMGLKSLKDLSSDRLPFTIEKSFYCSNNKLTSLEGIHKVIKKMNGAVYAGGNLIKSHVLGVLLIDGCKSLSLIANNSTQTQEVESIINKYLPNKEGMSGVLKCQEELFDADLDEYAQL